jgi:hypothetical protein
LNIDDQIKVDDQEVEKSSAKIDISYEDLSEVIIRRCIFLLTCINGPENSWELRNESSFKEDLILSHSNKYFLSFLILHSYKFFCNSFGDLSENEVQLPNAIIRYVCNEPPCDILKGHPLSTLYDQYEMVYHKGWCSEPISIAEAMHKQQQRAEVKFTS